ncbi:MAG: hypothetical protein QNK03_24260 [Myxococcota bacterium]|nr:hypothetical protein [Myxococcota bacterium]
MHKTEQLQIRVSASQKLAIKKQAERAGRTMSEWILSRLLPSPQTAFQELVADLATSDEPSYAVAELLELLGSLNAAEFENAVAELPAAPLSPYWQNYLAATVEQAAATKRARVPSWTREIAPLDEPVFGSSLRSLRLHLLLNSPPAFAQRNIFIDASVGDRV